MKTKEEIREWVEGQFYSDIEDKTPCEDYENFGEAHLSNIVQLMYDSLCRFLGVE